MGQQHGLEPAAYVLSRAAGHLEHAQRLGCSSARLGQVTPQGLDDWASVPLEGRRHPEALAIGAGIKWRWAMGSHGSYECALKEARGPAAHALLEKIKCAKTACVPRGTT